MYVSGMGTDFRDINNDGWTDYIIGNKGTNSFYNPSKKHPLEIYSKDFDLNGTVDPIMTHYIGETKYIIHPRKLLIDQIPAMNGRFDTFSKYANASFNQSFHPEDLKETYHAYASTFQSGILVNKEGKFFDFLPFPNEAQISPVFGAISAYIDDDFYEDIRTYGRGHEEYYRRALNDMVRFLRFHGDERPVVVAAEPGDTHPALIRVKDYLTWGEELEVPVDLVVLAVGITPRKVDNLIKMLKISPGNDRFLLEVHPKLRPVETAVPGVILAGTAQGPMNIKESCTAASAAAAKVSALLSQGQVELEPFVAQVNPDKCDGTGACIDVCCYEDAIILKTITTNGRKVQRAVVTPANCAGCGNCVSACPNRAIDVQGWTLSQYEAMVEAIAIDNWEAVEVTA